MSKGKSRQNKQPIPVKSQPQPAAQPQFGAVPISQAPPALQKMMLGYDPSGKIIPIDVVSSKTGWSEFELSDGTVIRIKGVVIDVKKAIDQYAADGKPIYITQMTMVPDFVVPDALMQKKPAG